ncbi:SNF2 family N-terminal domain-containing protein [Obelidium mucronatum]|nr:SNF2 family N-terminal domain-containing protein [Obelidium mucronatum]
MHSRSAYRLTETTIVYAFDGWSKKACSFICEKPKRTNPGFLGLIFVYGAIFKKEKFRRVTGVMKRNRTNLLKYCARPKEEPALIGTVTLVLPPVAIPSNLPVILNTFKLQLEVLGKVDELSLLNSVTDLQRNGFISRVDQSFGDQQELKLTLYNNPVKTQDFYLNQHLMEQLFPFLVPMAADNVEAHLLWECCADRLPPAQQAEADDLVANSLKCQLKSYQAANVQWMIDRERGLVGVDIHPAVGEFHINARSGRLYFKANPQEFQSDANKILGGFLADEMGLGKTICALSLIRCHIPDDDIMPMPELLRSAGTLVVIPDTLVDQWAAEIEDHMPNHNYYIYKRAGLQGGKGVTTAELADFEIVLLSHSDLSTEYHLSSDGKETRQSSTNDRAYSHFTKIYWRRIVVDEIQKVQKPKRHPAELIAKISARFRWGMSGTPMAQKGIEDLENLTKLFPNMNDDMKDLAKRREKGEFHKHILFYPMIMRRNFKKVVNDELMIPPQIEFVVPVPFSFLEKILYDTTPMKCENIVALRELSSHLPPKQGSIQNLSDIRNSLLSEFDRDFMKLIRERLDRKVSLVLCKEDLDEGWTEADQFKSLELSNMDRSSLDACTSYKLFHTCSLLGYRDMAVEILKELLNAKKSALDKSLTRWKPHRRAVEEHMMEVRPWNNTISSTLSATYPILKRLKDQWEVILEWRKEICAALTEYAIPKSNAYSFSPNQLRNQFRISVLQRHYHEILNERTALLHGDKFYSKANYNSDELDDEFARARKMYASNGANDNVRAILIHSRLTANEREFLEKATNWSPKVMISENATLRKVFNNWDEYLKKWSKLAEFPVADMSATHLQAAVEDLDEKLRKLQKLEKNVLLSSTGPCSKEDLIGELGKQEYPLPSLHPEFVGEKLKGAASWGFKIDLIAKLVLHIIKKDETAKIILYSRYLPLISGAIKLLEENKVSCMQLETSDKNKKTKKHTILKFQTNPQMKVLFLNLKSQYCGLNLTISRYLILAEPDLNPVFAEQAKARSHRIGQTAETYVYNFVRDHSIEDRIFRLSHSKNPEWTEGSVSEDVDLESDMELLFQDNGQDFETLVEKSGIISDGFESIRDKIPLFLKKRNCKSTDFILPRNDGQFSYKIPNILRAEFLHWIKDNEGAGEGELEYESESVFAMSNGDTDESGDEESDTAVAESANMESESATAAAAQLRSSRSDSVDEGNAVIAQQQSDICQPESELFANAAMPHFEDDPFPTCTWKDNSCALDCLTTGLKHLQILIRKGGEDEKFLLHCGDSLLMEAFQWLSEESPSMGEVKFKLLQELHKTNPKVFFKEFNQFMPLQEAFAEVMKRVSAQVRTKPVCRCYRDMDVRNIQLKSLLVSDFDNSDISLVVSNSLRNIRCEVCNSKYVVLPPVLVLEAHNNSKVAAFDSVINVVSVDDRAEYHLVQVHYLNEGHFTACFSHGGNIWYYDGLNPRKCSLHNFGCNSMPSKVGDFHAHVLVLVREDFLKGCTQKRGHSDGDSDNLAFAKRPRQ